MLILRTILFTAATAIVSFAFVINGVSRVLAGRYSRRQHEAQIYKPARQLLDQTIAKGWLELQQKAEWLEKRIDQPEELLGQHVKLVSGEEIDVLVKDCDEFTDEVRDAIRNEHKKFKKLPHDYQQAFSIEQHSMWHQIHDEAQVIKRKFRELRLTGW